MDSAHALHPIDPASLAPEAAAVLDALEGAGHEAWVVGGWVRDSLRGDPVHDVDVACRAPWEETGRILQGRGFAVIPTGTAHGTVTAVVDGVPIEVTTYRHDGAYTDGRHPDTVTFVDSIDEDLARRDLTMNAMAWHPARGLRDPFGGARDLAWGLVRAVGDPDRRMGEDALRVLRAVRFAARFGFSLEPATQRAVDACAPDLARVAQERIGMELSALLATGHGGWAVVRQRPAMVAAIPELALAYGFSQRSPYHSLDVAAHTARVMDYVEVMGAGAAPSALRWAALLHDIAKPLTLTVDDGGHGHFYGHPEKGATMARAILRRLAIPGDLAREAVTLVELHDRPIDPTERALRKLLVTLEARVPGRVPQTFFELFRLKQADAFAKAPAYRDYAVELEEHLALGRRLLAAGTPRSVSQLPLGGSDLMALGMEPGPAMGALLRRALDAVVAGEVENDHGALMAWAATSMDEAR